jgi:3-hydroxyacyl-CoA dehydrogenase / 3-hydroxy-2-methylbutyryl-CoA dehydrogenase
LLVTCHCSDHFIISLPIIHIENRERMKIHDRTFVVSGGASGLGEATVRMIYENGGYVSILDMNAENGQRIAKELAPRAVFYECDVTDSDSIAAAVKGTMEWVGSTGKELGGCVPAAGVGIPGKVCS